MPRKTIKERYLGTHTIRGTDHPVFDQLVRDQRPGSRPTWQIVSDLCNGVPDRCVLRVFDQLQEAREATDDAELQLDLENIMRRVPAARVKARRAR